MKHLPILLLIAFCWGWSAEAQSQLYFDLDADTYFRDAEFDSHCATGSTYVGFRLTPTLRYSLEGIGVVQGGLLLNCIAGTSGIYQWAPLLSITYNHSPWFTLAMGSFTDGLSHQLDEPFFSSERWFSTPVENGVRILTHTKPWQSETWIDWEHYLVPWTTDQEVFTAGTRHQLSLLHDSANHLHILGLFLVRHHGGELTDSHLPTESLMQESAALRYLHTTSHGDSISAKLPFLFEQSNRHYNHSTTFPSGWGLYPQLSVSTPLHEHPSQRLQASLGYWIGHQWETPLGNHQFMSTSEYRNDVVEPVRHLATLSATYCRSFPQLSLLVGGSLYYDAIYHNLDYLVNFSLHFHHTHCLSH